MNPAVLLLASGVGVGVALTVFLWRSTRHQRQDLVVVFELQLPSKWAAQLTEQTLANEGIQSRILESAGEWRCCVTKPMGRDRSQVEPTCRKLNQIATARGGGCAAHRITLGTRTQVFEH